MVKRKDNIATEKEKQAKKEMQTLLKMREDAEKKKNAEREKALKQEKEHRKAGLQRRIEIINESIERLEKQKKEAEKQIKSL